MIAGVSIVIALAWTPVQSATPAGVATAQAATQTFDFARAANGDEDVVKALVDQGTAAAEAALSDFGAHPLEQRVRAYVVELAGGPSSIPTVLALLAAQAGVDAPARAAFVRFLARPELAIEMSAQRVDRLAALVLADPDFDVRAAAVRALVDLEDPGSLARLDALLDDLPSRERAGAAGLMAASTRGRNLARARLQRTATEGSDAATYAALLVPCARAMADAKDGGATAVERAPFVAAMRHPDARVRRAARDAIDVLVSRLAFLQQSARAMTLMDALQQEGLDLRLALQQRVRLALTSGIGAAHVARDGALRDDALRDARAIDLASRTDDPLEARAWSARSAQLEGLTLLAAGDADAAAAPLARAARLFDALTAERIDLRGKEETAVHVRWLEERAVVAVAETVRLLALAIPVGSGTVPAGVDSLVLESARRAHTHALEAQLRATRADLDSPRTLDAIFASDMGAFDLVLDVRRDAAWPAARSIAVRIAVGRAFASIVPFEMIGFEPYASPNPSITDTRLTDPLKDPVRLQILSRIGVAEGDRIAQERSKMRVKILEHMATPAGADPEEHLRFLELEMRLQESLDAQRNVEDGDAHELIELRVPSSAVTWVARLLRDENRAEEARPLLLRAREQLDNSDVAQRFYWGTEMLAEIETTLGGSYTDAGDPAQAEMQMTKAVDRLQALEDAVAERDGSKGVIEVLRNERCNTLVSLAVNANVRMHDPKKAVEWFEKAWAIRKDESMRALLACYRARSGKVLEARALLRSIEPGPATWYNIACTYALLGDKELAFEYLRLEIEQNQPTRGSLERQQSWARTDPDLDALHGDPRFLEIVGTK